MPEPFVIKHGKHSIFVELVIIGFVGSYVIEKVVKTSGLLLVVNAWLHAYILAMCRTSYKHLAMATLLPLHGHHAGAKRGSADAEDLIQQVSGQTVQ